MRSLPSHSELTACLESLLGKPTCFSISGCPHLLQVGGFYITDIAAWISWMKYLSFIFYSYNLLLKVSGSGRTIRLKPSQPPTFHCPAILERRDAKWYEHLLTLLVLRRRLSSVGAPCTTVWARPPRTLLPACNAWRCRHRA